jgi:hypothetical protein
MQGVDGRLRTQKKSGCVRLEGFNKGLIYQTLIVFLMILSVHYKNKVQHLRE